MRETNYVLILLEKRRSQSYIIVIIVIIFGHIFLLSKIDLNRKVVTAKT